MLLSVAIGRPIILKKDYSVVFTEPSYWPNIIFNPIFSSEKAEESIMSLLSDHENGHGPKYIMSNPCSTDLELLKTLDSLNLKAGSWTAMSRSLQNIPEPNHEKLEIEIVESKSQLMDWIGIVNTVLMGENSVSTKLFESNLEDSRFQLFVGKLNGKPVATSMAFSENKTTGVYLVATVPAYQGQGIGRDLTIRAMIAGKSMRCAKAVLQATSSGLKVYQKLGFKDCGEIAVFDISKFTPK